MSDNLNLFAAIREIKDGIEIEVPDFKFTQRGDCMTTAYANTMVHLKALRAYYMEHDIPIKPIKVHEDCEKLLKGPKDFVTILSVL